MIKHNSLSEFSESTVDLQVVCDADDDFVFIECSSTVGCFSSKNALGLLLLPTP